MQLSQVAQSAVSAARSALFTIPQLPLRCPSLIFGSFFWFRLDSLNRRGANKGRVWRTVCPGVTGNRVTRRVIDGFRPLSRDGLGMDSWCSRELAKCRRGVVFFCQTQALASDAVLDVFGDDYTISAGVIATGGRGQQTSGPVQRRVTYSSEPFTYEA